MPISSITISCFCPNLLDYETDIAKKALPVWSTRKHTWNEVLADIEEKKAKIYYGKF